MIANKVRLPLKDVEPNYQIEHQMWECDKNKQKAEQPFYDNFTFIAQFQKYKIDCYTPTHTVLLYLALTFLLSVKCSSLCC